jgi:hypothetical protein
MMFLGFGLGLMVGFLWGSYSRFWKVYYGPEDDFMVGPDCLSLQIKSVGVLTLRTGIWGESAQAHFEVFLNRPLPEPQWALYWTKYEDGHLIGEVTYIFGKEIDWRAMR